MAFKQSKHIFTGMSRDLSDDKQKAEFYINAHNIRLTAREDNTLLSVTNEKGNKIITFSGEGKDSSEQTINTYQNYESGQYYIGHAVINNYFILFIKNTQGKRSGDYIWRFNLKKQSSRILYKGNLGFDVNYPIETLVDYETNDIQKVYWTDGVKVPRVINIAEEDYAWYTDTQFDFVQSLRLEENVSIEKRIDEGLYTTGTIQYVLTYTNSLGIETTPFYVSPLYYISPENRGGAPNETVANNFKINIENVDPNFKYVNIYSIQHTSNDTDTICKFVTSVNILPTSESTIAISYIDTGITGETVEPASLFYLGSRRIVAYTIAAKDNTLFLGNITLKNLPYSQELADICRDLVVKWETRTSSVKLDDNNNEYYAYKSQLSHNSNQIKVFKQRETYRLGLQFQEDDGNWSDPYFVQDSVNEGVSTITYDENGYINFTYPRIIIPPTLYTLLSSLGYKKVRPVLAESTLADRTILCQGIICPTVYNVEDRVNNAPFVQSSWFARPELNIKVDHCYYYVFRSNSFIDNAWPNLSDTIQISSGGHTYVFKVRFISKIANYNLQAVAQRISAVPVMILWLISRDGVEVSPFYDYSNSFTIGSSYTLSNSNNQQIGTTWKFITTEKRYENPNTPEMSPDKILENGMYTEFRHNYPIPDNYQLNGEIQSSSPLYSHEGHFDKCYVHTGSESYLRAWLQHNSNQFFVDKSIITFHSPDIELSTTLHTVDTTPYKLRIVGIAPIDSYFNDTSITVENGPMSHDKCIPTSGTISGHESTNIIATGSFKLQKGVKGTTYNYSTVSGGFRSSGYPRWIDALIGTNSNVSGWGYGPKTYKAAFPVYPWHRTGPLNNGGVEVNNYSTSMLKRKKMSYINYSRCTVFFTDSLLNYGNNREVCEIDCTTAQLFSDTGSPVIKIDAPENSGLTPLNYYGSYDKLIVSPDTYKISIWGLTNVWTFGDGPSGNSDDFTLTNWVSTLTTEGDVQTNYYLQSYVTTATTANLTNLVDLPNAVYYIYIPMYGSEGVRISYRSSPHYVMALNYSTTGAQTILPMVVKDSIITNSISDPARYYRPFWDMNSSTRFRINQKFILDYSLPSFGNEFLYIGELYNPNVDNRFGGDSREAIEKNKWIPAGDSVDISTGNTVYWTEGDTYYQRFDCLKAYEYSNESTNSNTEIVSFMCETRINIDGRYDRNRGTANSLYITNENFNLINDAYSQENNLYTYQQLGKQFTTTKFPNQITWSKTKAAGALKDNWASISLANTLDLDGDKGEITSLNKYRNDIIAFQSSGISQIIYNPNVQINTNTGMPVELANSGRVEGKRYLSENIGCQNKWSICDESIDNLYFIDNYNKGIYRLGNEGLISLTDNKGFTSWMHSNNTTSIWKPYSDNDEHRNFRTFYDKINKDVYFVNDKNCLVYSDLLKQFVSFMDYQNTDAMVNVAGEFYAIYKTNIYTQFAGPYNYIYEEIKPYSITFIENQYPELNKIFTNLEYRGDRYKEIIETGEYELESFKTFDTIKVFNEYQESDDTDIQRLVDTPSALQKKFRIWRIQLPRDKSNHFDRISNTWTKITLTSKNTDLNTDKQVLHDAVVGYYF